MTRETGALLTPSQRAYLDPDVESDIEPGSSTERVVRSRIRTRLREGMGDAELILRELDPDDIRKALEHREDASEVDEMRLEKGMASMIGMIYLAGVEREADLTRLTFLRGLAKDGLVLATNALGARVEQVAADIMLELGGNRDDE